MGMAKILNTLISPSNEGGRGTLDNLLGCTGKEDKILADSDTIHMLMTPIQFICILAP